MANDNTYKGKIKQKTSSGVDILHPETEADVVLYDNSASGLGSTSVQGAIDEIVESGVGVKSVKIGSMTDSKTGDVVISLSEMGAQAIISNNTAIVAEENSSTNVITLRKKVRQSSGQIATGLETLYTYNKIKIDNIDTRLQNVEARGRFLSVWDASTGLPQTYPKVPSGATYPYTYTYKAGDYYIVGTTGTGTKYKPSGASIVKETASSSWTVGHAQEALSVQPNDLYTYDGTNWVLVSGSKTVAWGNITGTLANQTDLQNALNDKANDGNVVHKGSSSSSVEETIYGSKTFNSSVNLPSGLYFGENSYTDITYNPAGYGTLTISSNGARGKIILDGDVELPDYVKIGSLTSTGLLKYTNGVLSVDTNSYLTQNQTITLHVGVDKSGTARSASGRASITLPNMLASALTVYSAVKVNQKGIVVDGGQVLNVVESGAADPGVVIGGWYFEKDPNQ